MHLLLIRAAAFLELVRTTSGKCSDFLIWRACSHINSAANTEQILGSAYLPWELIFSMSTIGAGRIRFWCRGVLPTMTGE